MNTSVLRVWPAAAAFGLCILAMPPAQAQPAPGAPSASPQQSQTTAPALEAVREALRRDGERDTGARAGLREAMMGHGRLFGVCGPRAGRRAERMLQWLEGLTQPKDAQRAAFDQLKAAAGRAMETARAGCPTERAITPPGRLAAAEKRLESMLQAVKTVRPAMDAFYGSLTDEQKARLFIAQARLRRDLRGVERWRDESRDDRRGEMRDRLRDRLRDDWRQYRHEDGPRGERRGDGWGREGFLSEGRRGEMRPFADRFDRLDAARRDRELRRESERGWWQNGDDDDDDDSPNGDDDNGQTDDWGGEL